MDGGAGGADGGNRSWQDDGVRRARGCSIVDESHLREVHPDGSLRSKPQTYYWLRSSDADWQAHSNEIFTRIEERVEYEGLNRVQVL